MEVREMTRPTTISKEALDPDFDKNFKPRGAIAFFLLLIILGSIIWFGIYLLMLERI
jgi:hypothetical protein